MPDAFFFEGDVLDENLKKIEKYFSANLSKKGSLGSRKDFYNFLKKSSGIRAWDILSWGEKRFLDIDDSFQILLLELGEDVYYRSLLMGSLGVILSSLYGCSDEGFLKSLYHVPLIVDYLYLNNSSFRSEHSVRPAISIGDQELGKFIARCKKYFPGVENDYSFFLAKKIAIEKVGSDDEDYLLKFMSTGMILQKIEKRTPLKIRFFTNDQWLFFKNNLLGGIFFILKNKKFYREVG